jgi:formylglycine-generating enzyme required for sulfatase activity
VSGFRLDKYDVTVGRFRQFANAVLPPDGGTGWLPPAGSGKHTHLNGGQGLANSGSVGTYETGWVTSDNSNIAPTNAKLACNTSPGYATWTPVAGSQEDLPINCVNWYEAYAFCIWDGGFLPSEAEWEYAAAGGNQQREYPWGTTDPGQANQYVVSGCGYPGGSQGCTGVANIAPVGTATLGAGLWGQLDLAGELLEWNLDWLVSTYVDPCTDCAYLTAPVGVPDPARDDYRVYRGGGFGGTLWESLPPYRDGVHPSYRTFNAGFRCARTP